ncbi:MAG: M14 family zinc carboxypeptidase [Vicinamibacterales bacterium]
MAPVPLRLSRLSGFLPLLLLVLSAPPVDAQRAPATRADADFAAAVKEWTTQPEFMSPLVDHLPVRAGVPTPKDVLGYWVGEPKKLTYWADQQKWYRALEQALPGRLKTSVIGKTEEGREQMVVYVTSEANLTNLEQNRQNLKKLADPRGLSDAEVERLLASTKPMYNLSGGLHSGETNPSEMLMELVYRLAVSEEPYIQKIRDNVIVSVIPTTDIDGRDRYVDWYYAYKIDEPADGSVNYGGPPYWGKYVFHDNNRDINYGVDTLRHYLEWYLDWVPPIWHDLHEQSTLLYTFSGQPPQNANLDPILYSELPFFANYEVNKLTGYGMPGVWHFGFVDMWSPGYLAFAASNHNGMIRMYEIFNQGGANTKRARLRGPLTEREWFRPNPVPAGEIDWSIRNSINYSETGVLTALELTSNFPRMVVENFYKKTIHSIEEGGARAPYAFVLPAGQPDQGQVDRVANLLRRQAIEVHRATGEVKLGDTTFPAGSYIVKLNQPYGRLAKTLLEKQNYPDPSLRTYDDSAWTMGLASNIEVKTVDDKAILEQPASLLTEDVTTPATITGASGAVWAIRHNGSLNLITLRYHLKDLAVKGATKAFAAGDGQFPAGSFLIPVSGDQGDRVRKEVEALGLVAAVLPAMPEVETVDVDLPRIAIYTTWQNTEKVGWVRLAFDRWEIPFDLIHKDLVQPGANLRGKYDVIVLPHQGNNGKSIVYESPKLEKPLPYKKSDRFKSFGMYAETDDTRGGMGLEGAAEIAKFVEDGGVLLSFGVASFFPAEFGIARQVDASEPSGNFYAPGPYVQTEIREPNHPVLYGYTGKNLPMRWGGGPLLRVPSDPTPFGPGNTSSPEQATTLIRFQGGEAGVLSGLMRGADQIRNRPAVVDAPVGKGHVILYVNNPIYRWQTFGEHELVFNALLYWNDMPGGKKAAESSGPR